MHETDGLSIASLNIEFFIEMEKSILGRCVLVGTGS